MLTEREEILFAVYKVSCCPPLIGRLLHIARKPLIAYVTYATQLLVVASGFASDDLQRQTQRIVHRVLRKQEGEGGKRTHTTLKTIPRTAIVGEL